MQIAYQHANDSVPTPSTKNPKVPAELDELVLWATARDPEERPRDARELLEQLRDDRVPARDRAAHRHDRDAEDPRLHLGRAGDRRRPGLGRRDHGARPSRLASRTRDRSPTAPRPSARARASAGGAAGSCSPSSSLLAGLAGGAGWWFGAGPGAHVTIPAVDRGHRLRRPWPRRSTTSASRWRRRTARSTASTCPPAWCRAPTPPSARASSGAPRSRSTSRSGAKPIDRPGARRADPRRRDVDARGPQHEGRRGSGRAVRRDDRPTARSSRRAAADGTDLSAGGASFEGVTVNLVVSVGALPPIQGHELRRREAGAHGRRTRRRVQAAGGLQRHGPRGAGHRHRRDRRHPPRRRRHARRLEGPAAGRRARRSSA